MKRPDPLRWNKRERVACGPGSNRSRAKARKLAKATGNRQKRRQGRVTPL